MCREVKQMSNQPKKQMRTTSNCVPQLLVVPYSIIDPKNTSLDVVPTKIHDGVYHLRSPHEIHIDSGKLVLFRTGIKLNLPKFIKVSPSNESDNVEDGWIPIVSVAVHLSSIFNVLLTKGLEVIGPHVLTADMLLTDELVVYIKNISDKMCVVNKGDEIAEMTFVLSPLTCLSLNQLERTDHE